jgi:hypothetical protein
LAFWNCFIYLFLASRAFLTVSGVIVSCIVNKVIFDESISDAQISQNTKGDAGHQRRTLWWLGAGRLSPCGLVSFGT